MKTIFSAFSTLLLVCISGIGTINAQGLSPERTAGSLIPGDRLFERQRTVAKPKPAKFEFSDAEVRSFEKETLALINRKRAELGLAPMAWSDAVAKVARLHSVNMASFNFFGHAGADGKMVDERADQLGVKQWKAIGENIAFNRGYDDPIGCAVEKWMLSDGHRKNLLNPRWKESGIGISIAADGSYYFTQVFLERR